MAASGNGNVFHGLPVTGFAAIKYLNGSVALQVAARPSRALSVGVVAVGSVSIAPVSLATIALGWIAFGGIAIGDFALGGFGAGWTGAAGGLAVAHGAAWGGYAIAAHANDAIAGSVLRSYHFELFLPAGIAATALLLGVPGLAYLFSVRRWRRRAEGALRARGPATNSRADGEQR
jgi:hypothetical protein